MRKETFLTDLKEPKTLGNNFIGRGFGPPPSCYSPCTERHPEYGEECHMLPEMQDVSMILWMIRNSGF
jgi:hypothetical protein